ncbi:tetrahydrocannabinolic acid synthase-like [Dorcoceras hygrometricum]|uniref:Tetrahydrocannabinolic acid synthase-like n=1 Tax=Dorcoceras hygrometricum TaxID=472368 RepID=A0A2Z7CSH3_9LAMI|nr:tetrahydrocannabinolic acid synthase-like [Dorcoceras hygrometricum]
MSNHSKSRAKILQNIFTPASPKYISLLELPSQNPRWFNETRERPFLIAAPLEETDIWSVIRCSKKLGVQVRIKSGGHDYEGLSVHSKSPFVMVDLTNLNSINIDLKDKTAWVQAGATLGQLYYQIASKSKTHAFPAGLCQGLGLGGHISSGGLETLLRKYGLAVDNVLDARFMDVKGNILDRKAMGEDLFWALTGGGGASFGVILAWKLKLVRIPEQVTVFFFRRILDLGDLSLLHKWQRTAHQLPEDLFTRVLVQKIGNGPGAGNIVQVTYNGMFLGPAAGLVQLLREEFPEFGLETEDVSWIQSVVFFSGRKPNQPAETLLSKFKNTKFFNKGTSDFLKAPVPDNGWKMIQEIAQVAEKQIAFKRSLHKMMAPYVAKSPRTAYINYKDLDLGENDEDYSYTHGKEWGEKYFKGNFERLAKIKGKVDPGNYFRNQLSIPVFVEESTETE